MPTTSTTRSLPVDKVRGQGAAHPVDKVREQGAVMIETLPESPTLLLGPSRGLCTAQRSGSPMTLKSAPATGCTYTADVSLECVEAGPSTLAPGAARDIAPALGAQSHAKCKPNSKQPQHGNDRRFFYSDLLLASTGTLMPPGSPARLGTTQSQSAVFDPGDLPPPNDR